MNVPSTSQNLSDYVQQPLDSWFKQRPPSSFYILTGLNHLSDAVFYCLAHVFNLKCHSINPAAGGLSTSVCHNIKVTSCCSPDLHAVLSQQS